MTADQEQVEVDVRRGIMRPSWYWWLAMLASTLAVGIGSVLIALRANAESDRKWCSVVSVMNEAYEGGTAPATPAGVKLRDGFAKLRDDLGCPRPGR